MIAKIINGKITKIKIGSRIIPEKGEVFFPDKWGTDDILSFWENKKEYISDKNHINPSRPDESFELIEI